jgi:chromosome partitioning protein
MDPERVSNLDKAKDNAFALASEILALVPKATAKSVPAVSRTMKKAA